MIRRWTLAGMLLCAACASGGSSMTLDTFYSVSVGTTRSELIEQAGTPYTTRKLADGSEEIEYIERIQAGSRNLEERHYIYTLQDGKVVSRRVERRSPPPWQFDSYEMQTTQNQSPDPSARP